MTDTRHPTTPKHATTLTRVTTPHPDRLPAIADALSIGRIDRHVFLCAEQTNPRCCTQEEGGAVWRYLKERLKELGLTSVPAGWRGSDLEGGPGETTAGDGCVLRTKVDCLRICEQGPIAVVYPEGTWYRGVDETAMERIIMEHLVGGTVVDDLVFATDDLDHGDVEEPAST